MIGVFTTSEKRSLYFANNANSLCKFHYIDYGIGKIDLNGDVTMTSLLMLTPPIEYTSSIDPVHQVWDRHCDWVTGVSARAVPQRYNGTKW